ncbi:RHS repeat-associated core domain-containing protein [Nocardioides jishulii]|uniref:Uncharacterized protein n=1 Tax=Nocardioides jishulii TaxID=2575440 RepID=A0A4U2YNE3_9ACTN|nr:polymorphic toxin type 24 domain-containing protein [Nocardioides jishulii]QCX27360.1 hypothetical protein FCL41_07365 [Nocardioides jishulii]TKI62165.1 hypothetical protein FC770_07030 [Nocardioides jishulii]
MARPRTPIGTFGEIDFRTNANGSVRARTPGTTSYSWTPDGQLSTGGRTYNALGQLKTATGPAGAASYTYTATGQRATITTAAGTTNWSWDINNALPILATSTAAGDTTAHRYRPTGEPLASTTIDAPGGDTQTFYLTDATGSVNETYDQTGTAQRAIEHDPWGVPLTDTPIAPGAPPTAFGYTGAITEPGTGELHLRARDYNPNWGRFTAPDPLTPPPTLASITTYQYAFNNPGSYTDPTGEWPKWLDEGIEWGADKVNDLVSNPQQAKTDFSAGVVGGAAGLGDLAANCHAAFRNNCEDYLAGGGVTYGKNAADWINETTGADSTSLAYLCGEIFGIPGAGAAGGAGKLSKLARLKTPAATAANSARSVVQGSRVVSGRFPRYAAPDDILVRRGSDGGVTHYQTYGPDGLPMKRVDVTGRAHGGVETPHVVEFERHVNPATGEVFVRPGSTVRPATPEELMGLE